MLHKRGIVRAFAGSDIYDFRKAHNSNLELESFSIGRKQNQRITLKALSCYHWGAKGPWCNLHMQTLEDVDSSWHCSECGMSDQLKSLNHWRGYRRYRVVSWDIDLHSRCQTVDSKCHPFVALQPHSPLKKLAVAHLYKVSWDSLTLTLTPHFPSSYRENPKLRTNLLQTSYLVILFS